jgi:regulatory subunit for Cdc7p protein kinase
MAEVQLSPSSVQTSFTMSRRVPLLNLPNGPNSPRGSASLNGPTAKRSRFQGPTAAPDYEQVLQSRKQVLNPTLTGRGSPNEKRRSVNAQSNEVPRISNERTARIERPKPGSQIANTHEIDQWRSHNREVFPQYVFYFDNLPSDFRDKCWRQITLLGAVSRSFPD